MITVPLWIVPMMITVAIWAWGIFMPMPRPQGDYDFSGALSAVFRLAVCIIVTLACWLVFFMWKSAP